MILSSWFFSLALLLILSLSVYIMNLSGSLNIGVEGIFLWGIFSSYFFLSWANSFILGLIFTFLSVLIFSLLFSFLRFQWNINENLVGIFLNLFLFQVLDFINKVFYKGQGILPLPSSFENIEDFRFIIIIVSFFIFLLVAYIIRKTSFGLKMRLNSLSFFYQEERGIHPYQIRILIFSLSSLLIAFCAISLLVSLNAYTLGLGVGMGWLSLFALLLGGTSLKGIFLSSALLSLVLTVSFNLQETLGFYFSSSLTYMITLISYFLVQYLRSFSFKGSLE